MTRKASATQPTRAAPEPDPELLERVMDFVCAFELVFDNDWSMTEVCLQDDVRDGYIRDGRTFLSPGVRDESNNWCNRGALLASYRDLVAYLADLVEPDEWNR